MKSGKTTKKFVPRQTAVANLFAENVRLQKLCVAHRKQIRGMQKNAEILKMKYQLAMVRLAAVATEGLVETMAANDAMIEASLPVRTQTVKPVLTFPMTDEERAEEAFQAGVPHEQFEEHA